MKNRVTYQLDISASTSNLSEVRNFIGLHAGKNGFSEKQIDEIRLAVDEAVTNIIKHAYKNDESKTIDILLIFTPKKLCVKLTDDGKNFKLDTYERPDLEKQIKQKKRGGMGVYLIHSLMDDVSYTRDNGKNKMEMCKNRNS